MPFDSKLLMEVLVLAFLSWWTYSVLATWPVDKRSIFDRTVKRRVTLVVLGPVFFVCVILFMVLTALKMLAREGLRAIPGVVSAWRQTTLTETLAKLAAQRREKSRVRRAQFLSDA